MSQDLPNNDVVRRLAAILVVDVVGYSRSMGSDAVGTMISLKACCIAVVDSAIARHNGNIFRISGDGILVEFASAADAVRCAVDVQRGVAERNEGIPPDVRNEYRIGINVGDIIFDDDDIQGDGVNVAARLESMADPGGIWVSRAVYDFVRDKLALNFEDLGEVAAKNIARSIHVFRVLPGPPDTGPLPKVLTISLIGGIGLAFDGREVPLPNRKALAMLAYLALSHPPEEQRERLTGLFWSESEQGKASTTLRQVVHETKVALEAVGCDSLRTTRLAVGLKQGSFRADIADELATLDTLKMLPPPPTAFWSCPRPPIPDIVELLLRQPRVADTLLGGFDDLDPAFRSWLLVRRQVLHDQLMRALEKGYRDQTTSRGTRRALAEAALLQDPSHEEACRTVMRCAAEGGEMGAALRAYDTLYRLLGEDYDMEPSGPTQELVAEIKQGKFDLVPASDEEPRHDLQGHGLPFPKLVSPVYSEPMPWSQVPTVFPQVADGPPWIAVLPFRSFGADPVPDYFADGLVDDIVCALAMLREPVTISAGSTLSYRNRTVDLRRVGRELGARYVASGSIRKSGPWLRIAVELAEAESGVVLWAQSYEVQVGMLFDAQDSIVGRIVGTWLPRLHEAEMRRVHAKRPDSMTAYDLVLQARDLVFRLNQDAFETAADLLVRALSLDPHYAAASVVMADLLNLRIGQGWSVDPATDAQDVDRMARAAISADPYNARALAIYGHNRSYMFRDYDAALTLFDRTTDAAPNDATGWMWSASTYAYIGDGAGAVARADRALRLSPRDPFLFRYHASLCLAHYTNGTYEEAIHWGRLGIQDAPQYTANLRFTAAALVGLGRLEEARDLMKQAVSMQPGHRARDVVERHPYRDLDRRMKIAAALVTAGLPE